MTTRVNKSWRENRKGVRATHKYGVDTFASLWEASHHVSEEFGCKPETAKKEIKKAITTGVTRYEAQWAWMAECGDKSPHTGKK